MEYTEKNLSEQGREQTTNLNPTHIWRRRESALTTALPLLRRNTEISSIPELKLNYSELTEKYSHYYGLLL